MMQSTLRLLRRPSTGSWLLATTTDFPMLYTVFAFSLLRTFGIISLNFDAPRHPYILTSVLKIF